MLLLPTRRADPIVLVPARHLTRLTFTVNHQTTNPHCARSGTFEDLVLCDPGPALPQVCREEPMTLRQDRHAHKPLRLRFHKQRGGSAAIPDSGKPATARCSKPMS